jgi:hypothetical protein
MSKYVEVNQDGVILQALGRPDQEGDELEPPPDGPHSYHLWNGPIDWNPPSPSSLLKWIDDAPTWVETATLEQLKARKNADINAWKLAANQASFPFAGKHIACDPSSMLEIQSVNSWVTLTGAMPDDWVGGWKATDNSYVPIADVATWTEFMRAMVGRGTGNFQHAQALKAQLAAAATPAEVEQVVWGT